MYVMDLLSTIQELDDVLDAYFYYCVQNRVKRSCVSLVFRTRSSILILNVKFDKQLIKVNFFVVGEPSIKMSTIPLSLSRPLNMIYRRSYYKWTSLHCVLTKIKKRSKNIIDEQVWTLREKNKDFVVTYWVLGMLA